MLLAFLCLNMGSRKIWSIIFPDTIARLTFLQILILLLTIFEYGAFFLLLHQKSLRQWHFKDEQRNGLVTIAPSLCRMLERTVLSPINVFTSKLLKWSPVCTEDNTLAFQFCHQTQGPGKLKDSPYHKEAKKALSVASTSFCTRLFWSLSLFTMFATHFSLVLCTYKHTFFPQLIM